MRDANLQEIIEKVTGEGDQLRKQTEFWKMVLEGSYDGICIVDGNANLVWMNSAYEKIAGLKEVDVIGKNLKELVEKGAMSCACSLLALEKKKVVTLEQVFRNGKRATVTSTPLFDEVGKIQMVVVNVRDISDIYRMQRKLEERFRQNQRYREEIDVIRQYLNSHTDLIATDPEMLNLLRVVKRAANMDTTILLRGETGVGKERIAAYIHQNSLRKHQKFIKVNCATIPDSLAESELFGYEKGAFTGAKKEGKMGLFEAADGGTIFLDEVGDLPLTTQIKLLRVLQEKEVIRVGGQTAKKIDVRILAATNRDLKAMVDNKMFRADLYYRLNVFPVMIPPLRYRRGDIRPLAESVLKELNQKYNLNKEISQAAFADMLEYDWPGNVRELRNVLERAYIMSNEKKILADDLGISGNHPAKQLRAEKEMQEPMNLKGMLEKIELEYLDAAYQAKGNIREAARFVEMDPTTFARRRKLLSEKFYAHQK